MRFCSFGRVPLTLLPRFDIGGRSNRDPSNDAIENVNRWRVGRKREPRSYPGGRQVGRDLKSGLATSARAGETENDINIPEMQTQYPRM